MSSDSNPYQAPDLVEAVTEDILAQRARRKIGPPTIGILALTVFSFVGATIFLISIAGMTALALWRGYVPRLLDEEGNGVLVLLFSLLFWLGGGVASYGVWQMRRFRSYRWAIVGSIAAMLLWPFSVVLAPLAIWGLLTLRSADVQEMFRRSQEARLASQSESLRT